MNWDWQYTDHQFLWHHMGPVNDLMSGIPLDDEFWQAMPPIVSTNKAVEVLYLRNYVTDNYRAVGAVSNRTYNYYTQATDTLCTPSDLPNELQLNAIYQVPQDFQHPIGTESLIIPNMGVEVEYKINWYNALTGAPLGTGMNSSDENGDFPLLFPLVSGDETRPILFFEIYRSDQPTFKSSLIDTLISKNEIIPGHIDSMQTSLVATNWTESVFQVTISPNPASDLVNVNIESTNEFTWTLQSSMGEHLINETVANNSFNIDMTSFAPGLYFLKISNGVEEYIFKILKS